MQHIQCYHTNLGPGILQGIFQNHQKCWIFTFVAIYTRVYWSACKFPASFAKWKQGFRQPIKCSVTKLGIRYPLFPAMHWSPPRNLCRSNSVCVLRDSANLVWIWMQITWTTRVSIVCQLSEAVAEVKKAQRVKGGDLTCTASAVTPVGVSASDSLRSIENNNTLVNRRWRRAGGVHSVRQRGASSFGEKTLLLPPPQQSEMSGGMMSLIRRQFWIPQWGEKEGRGEGGGEQEQRQSIFMRSSGLYL